MPQIFIQRTVAAVIPLDPAVIATSRVTPRELLTIIGNTKAPAGATNRIVSAYTASSSPFADAAAAGESAGISIWQKGLTAGIGTVPDNVPLTVNAAAAAYGADIGGSSAGTTYLASVAPEFLNLSGAYNSQAALSSSIANADGLNMRSTFRIGGGLSLAISPTLFAAPGPSFSLTGGASYDFTTNLQAVAGKESADIGFTANTMSSLVPFGESGIWANLDNVGPWLIVASITSNFAVTVDDAFFVAAALPSSDQWLRVTSASTDLVPGTHDGTLALGGVALYAQANPAVASGTASIFLHGPSISAAPQSASYTMVGNLIQGGSGQTYDARVITTATASTDPRLVSNFPNTLVLSPGIATNSPF